MNSTATPAPGSRVVAADPFSRRRTTAAIAGACAVGVAVVAALARPPTPVWPTIATLLVQAALCLAVSATHGLRPRPTLPVIRGLCLFAVGALTAVPAWFFGPNGVFAGVVAMLLVISGVLAEAQVAWPTFVGLAGGQLLLVIGVLAHVIPDRSLLIVIVRPQPLADYIRALVSLQCLYLGAFLGARAFHRRYRALAEEVDDAERGAAAKHALLDEARADYMRALHIGRAGGHRATTNTGTSRDAPTPAAMELAEAATAVDPSADTRVRVQPDEAVTAALELRAAPSVEPQSLEPKRAPVVAAALPSTVTGPRAALDAERPPAPGWTTAYRARMRFQRVGVTVACAMGAVGLVLATRPALPIVVGCVSLAGVAITTWAGSIVAQRRGNADPPYWPWTVNAALAVGPAYAYGLHSAFLAALAPLLFLGGLFRAAHREERSHRRARVLVALCVTHGLVFLLVVTGLVPDDGAVPVFSPGMRGFEPWIAQLFVQATLIFAFAAGSVVDRRYEALSREAHRIARETAKEEALLATTDADIARLASEDGDGIFAGHQVGDFLLSKLLGRGGMGDVYEATDLIHGRRAAVKIVGRDGATRATTLEFFALEIEALARIRSAHVAEVYAAGGIDDELPYVAMEFIDGPSLASVLRERSRLPLEEVRDLVRDAASGLAAIHAAQMVHRDVKPQNLVRGTDGWKLIDLGVAQMHAVVGQPDRFLVGTPQYMAPEQALREPVDRRADLYSLCLVAYRAITGHPAYSAASRTKSAEARRGSGPPNPGAYVSLPRDVEAVMRIGLAARPDDRFASAAELGEAFVAACNGTLGRDVRARAAVQLVVEPWTDG